VTMTKITVEYQTPDRKWHQLSLPAGGYFSWEDAAKQAGVRCAYWRVKVGQKIMDGRER